MAGGKGKGYGGPRERVEFFSYTKDQGKKSLKVRFFCSKGVDVLQGQVHFVLIGGNLEGPEKIDVMGYVEHEFKFTNLPDQDKVVVRAQLAGKALYGDSPQIDISDIKGMGGKKAGASKEPTMMHVRRIPVGPDKWLLEGELRSKGNPVEGYPIRMLYEEFPYTVATLEHGQFEKELTVPKRTVVPVIATSRLTVHVPLLGPDVEKPAVLPLPATGWRKNNNKVFLIAFLIFVWILVRTVWDIGESIISPTPYTFDYSQAADEGQPEEEWEKEARRIREQYSGGPSSAPSPVTPTQTTKKKPDPPGLVKKFVDMLVPFVSYSSWHDPHSWFRIWFTLFYFLFLVFVLAPLCFYDEVGALIKGTIQKVKREATGFGQKRVAQEYIAELKEQEGKITTVFYIDGKETETTAPKPQEGIKTDLTGASLFKRMIKADILAEIIIKIFTAAFKRIFPF